MNLLPCMIFEYDAFGHLENTGSESYRPFEMLIHLIMQHQKITVIYITSALIRSPLSIGKLLSSWWWLVIQNPKFHLTAWNSVLAITPLVVFLEVTGLLPSFLRNCLPDTSIRITFVCHSVVLSSKNDVSWKKKRWLFPLDTQTIAQVLFLEVAFIFQYVAEVLFKDLQFCHTKC